MGKKQQFTIEFKFDAVKLALEGDKSQIQTATDPSNTLSMDSEISQ